MCKFNYFPDNQNFLIFREVYFYGRSFMATENKNEIGRLRDTSINFRVTNFEHDIIMHNFKESGSLSFRDFATKLLSDGYVLNINTSDLHSYAYEINKIGTNINQIAHKVNQLDDKSLDFHLLKQDVSECLFLMEELTKIVRRHWLS